MRKKIMHSAGKAVGLGLFTAFILMMSATVDAQCGASLTAMMTAAASARSQTVTRLTKTEVSQPSVPSTSKDGIDPSIVGLWHIRFMVDTPDGPLTIQEAFQIWNQGGTEVHNPNVDPRTNNICLGTWIQAPTQVFKLNHRVWFYDTSGNFQGLGFLTESITLGNGGQTQSGTFTLEIHDPNGNVVATVPGNVVGERIVAN